MQTRYKTAMRLLLAYALFFGLCLAFARYYATLWLPLYRAELAMLAPQYTVVDLRLQRPGGETLIALDIKTARAINIGTKTVPAGVTMNSSTLMGNVVQHPIIYFSILLAWPGFLTRERLFLLLTGLPLLVLVEALDLPFILLGALEDLMLYNLAPDQLPGSRLVTWMDFLNGGGRLALSAAAAVCNVAIFRYAEEAALVYKR